MSAPPTDARTILRDLRAMPADQVVEPGVTAGDALTVMTVPPVPEGRRYVPDQVYGTAGRPLRMHLYAAPAGAALPAVVFVHGGGFVEGFPEMLIRYAARLAAAGYVTASIAYRLGAEARWPAALEDVKCAIRWLRHHAEEVGVDPDRIGVAGGSAGGTLAALAAGTPGRFEGTGGWPGTASTVRAAVLWYPPVDLRAGRVSDAVDKAAGNLFGRDRVPEDLALEASPRSYPASAPPTLTLTGDADALVPVESVRDYHRALSAAGVPNRLVEIPGAAHSFDFGLSGWQMCFEELRSWFDRYLA